VKGSEIMSVQPFILRPDQHEPALNVVGTQVTVLASNAATHSYGIALQQGEEGTGPPPHRHEWGEIGLVLDLTLSPTKRAGECTNLRTVPLVSLLHAPANAVARLSASHQPDISYIFST
jgi:hypothetical protein